jgi:ankyrin repeat protein
VISSDLFYITAARYTALHLAVDQSNLATNEALVSAGANVNYRDEYRTSPRRLAGKYAGDKQGCCGGFDAFRCSLGRLGRR